MNINDFILRETNKPYRIDDTDCCHVCNRWIFENTGLSPITEYLYSTEEESLEILKANGGLLKCVSKALERFEKIKTPEIGCVGVISFDDKVSPAIYTGDIWFTRHKDGFVLQQYPKIIRMWKIG